jgi:hypothetical protein
MLTIETAQKTLPLTVLLAVLFLAGGCGDGTTPLSLAPSTGTVFYNDKPLAGASVTFFNENAPLATGMTNAEGKFTITTGGRPGAPIGNAKVFITKISAQQSSAIPANPTPEDMRKMAIESMGKAVSQSKSEIPEKYGNPQTSGLVATVLADGSKNVFEFRLVD